MAAPGEKSFWSKLADDLLSVRVSTIVTRNIRGGQVPPEPAVMLYEIAHDFDNCLREFQAKPRPPSSADRDILERIETSSAEIGRIYAMIDARARPRQEDAAVKRVKQQLRTRKASGALAAASAVAASWEREDAVSRDTFARLRDLSRGLSAEPRDWQDKGAAGGVRSAIVGIADAAEDPDAPDGELLPSSWRIEPTLLEAPTGTRAGRVDATNHDYQEACRLLFQLEPDEAVIVRKIWELGTDVVVMETVVQVDGDVIARVRQGHQEDLDLQSSHRALLATAMGNWHFLVETVGKLFHVIEEILIKKST